MTSIEIANLEHASRSAFAWVPESYDGRTHYGPLMRAFVPALGIIAVAAVLLLALV